MADRPASDNIQYVRGGGHFLSVALPDKKSSPGFVTRDLSRFLINGLVNGVDITDTLYVDDELSPRTVKTGSKIWSFAGLLVFDFRQNAADAADVQGTFDTIRRAFEYERSINLIFRDKKAAASLANPEYNFYMPQTQIVSGVQGRQRVGRIAMAGPVDGEMTITPALPETNG